MAALVQQAPWGAPRYGKPHEAIGRGISANAKVSAPTTKSHSTGASSQSMPLRSVHYGRPDARTRDELQATSVRVPKHELEKPTPHQGSRQVQTPQQGCREVIPSTASLPSTPPPATRSLQGGAVSGTLATNQAQNGRVQAQAESKMKELEAELLRVREESAAKSKLLADQAAELSNLVGQMQLQHADLLRIKAEGAQLRADLGFQQPNSGPMQQPNVDDYPEEAALQIQRAVRKWRARQHGDRAVSSEMREKWKLTLRAVEDANQLALDTILSDSGSDISSVPRNTRLQLLANTLKQGVLKVNQVMMHETLQDLRRSGPLSDCSRRSGPVASMFDTGSLEA
mmetsp:Transcript_110568/g.191246  ORF Transcript_110568/g.191246 Transcript_110568/m.191246 type:complete len:342 (-) Transcript_110568:7-1032(-)